MKCVKCKIREATITPKGLHIPLICEICLNKKNECPDFFKELFNIKN
jgi:hypothetical protein